MGEHKNKGYKMITSYLAGAKLEKSEDNITAKAGLVFTREAMKHFGVDGILDNNFLQLYSPYTGSEKLWPALLTLIGGGYKLEDIEVTRTDKALMNQCGFSKVCSPDTVRNFLAAQQNTQNLICSIDTINKKTLTKALEQTFTLDIDWTFIPADKESATYSYLQEKGYGAMLGFIKETNAAITFDYRPGNESPASGYVEGIQKANELALSVDKRILSFRADSAAHSKKVFSLCDEFKIKYYVTVDQNELVKETIINISQKDWHVLPETEDREYSETVYPMNGMDTAIRIVIVRWRPRNDTSIFHHHAVATNNNEMTAIDVIKFHNQRMGAENYNKEIKSGFGLDYCPSNDLTINRNYFYLGLLAYNLLEATKQLYMPEDCRKWQVRTMRWWFINTCGQLIKHSRSLTYRLINLCDNSFEIFRHIQSKLCYAT